MLNFEDMLALPEFNLSKVLISDKNYYAHTGDDFYETLEEHTTLTLAYAIKLIEANKLEPIIDSLSDELTKTNLRKSLREEKDFVKKLFIKTIYFHDFGKVNENFQAEVMGNIGFTSRKSIIGTKHSALGAYLYIASALQDLKESNISQDHWGFLFLCALLFSQCILRHHGKLGNSTRQDNIFSEEELDCLEKYLCLFTLTQSVDKVLLRKFLLEPERRKNCYELLKGNPKYFELFVLVKLNSSLLTAADYYATNEFKLGFGNDDFGVLSEKIIGKIVNNVFRVPYNTDLTQFINGCDERLDFSGTEKPSNDNLNKLRKNLAIELISEIAKQVNNKLFYIEAPTGSGKTNLSLLALSVLLRNRKNITKIFYVFPFTTLITQTTETLENSTGLDSNEIVEIHSKAPFTGKKKLDDESNIKRNFIDSLFVNYPICLISHVRFFDILTSNEKEANYLLHRLANSVVIIDEIQSYTPTEWDKVNYLISKYSQCLNIDFVVMSATLPKISRLIIGDGESKDNFVYLVKNKNRYFLNPNFKDRVVFDFSLLEADYSTEMLLDKIYEECERYYERYGSIRAVVEFVTKKAAQDFFSKLKDNNRFKNYKKMILTGNVLEPRRKEIIWILKNDRLRGEKILLVTTQVIEAGVDIDMDLGFKDKSIVDSEEQLAGRINRNITKQGCKLFIFQKNDSDYVYQQDLRYKQHVNFDTYKRILNEKDYDFFYDLVFQEINAYNKDEYAENLGEFFSHIRNLDYSRVTRDLKLIANENLGVFVPLILCETQFNPSESEKRFLIQIRVLDETSQTISGKKIWEFYTSLITDKDIDFIDKKINLKLLAPIMSRFTFSTWNNPKQVNLIKHYCDGNGEKFGYFYMENYHKVYSYEEGLKADIETDCNLI